MTTINQPPPFPPPFGAVPPRPPVPPKRGVSGKAIALVGTVLVLGLVLGAGGGYLSRNGEVSRAQDDLTASKAETKVAREETRVAREEAEQNQQEADQVSSRLSSAETRLTACDAAVEDLRADLLAMTNASISASNGEYLSALDTLNSIDASVSDDEAECTGGDGESS